MIDVTINVLPTVDLGVDIIQCGGSVTLDAVNVGSTYLWSDASTAQTIIVSTTGTYYVTVTDGNGCTGTDVIDVTINALPTVDLGLDVTQCGGSVTLDAANVGSAYLWSDASTAQTLIVSTTDTYAVTVTDANGCTSADTVNVTIYTVSPVTITENAGVLTSDATSGNQWYEQTLGIIAGETNQTYTPTITGNYYVIVTDVNGCIDTSNVISFLISVNSYASSSSISVYPNPANAQVWIDVVNKNSSQTKIEIRTLDGKLLFENRVNSLGNTRISVDLKEFASGIYIIKATSNENTSIQKLVVN